MGSDVNVRVTRGCNSWLRHNHPIFSTSGKFITHFRS